MRQLILNSITGLCIAIATATATAAFAEDYDKPIPQDAAKREAQDRSAVAWTECTIAQPFEKIGKKDPRWDAKARASVALAAKKFTGWAGTAIRAEDVYKAAKDAVDAGCDDPLVLYFYARMSTGPDYPGDAEYERRMVAAAAALEKSQYPPIRRANALCQAAGLKAVHKDDPAARKEAERLLAAMLALLPESVKVDGTGPEASQIWYELLFEAFHTWKALGDDSKGAYDKIDEAIAKESSAKALRLQVRGTFYKNYAWEARGNGFAETVTEEGFRKFHERLEEAGKALEAAWKLRPDDGRTASLMLIVELGIGDGDRDRMERWFRRGARSRSRQQGRLPQQALLARTQMAWLARSDDVLRPCLPRHEELAIRHPASSAGRPLPADPLPGRRGAAQIPRGARILG